MTNETNGTKTDAGERMLDAIQGYRAAGYAYALSDEPEQRYIHHATWMDTWMHCADYADTQGLYVRDDDDMDSLIVVEDFKAWLAMAVAGKPGVCPGCIAHIGDYIDRMQAVSDAGWRKYNDLRHGLRAVGEALGEGFAAGQDSERR